jgi:hypothetical protein
MTTSPSEDVTNDQNNPDPNTPLLTIAEVEAWRNELKQLTEEITTKNFRTNWLRQRLTAAQIFINTVKENP